MISPLRQQAESRNLGHTFLANSVCSAYQLREGSLVMGASEVGEVQLFHPTFLFPFRHPIPLPFAAGNFAEEGLILRPPSPFL